MSISRLLAIRCEHHSLVSGQSETAESRLQQILAHSYSHQPEAGLSHGSQPSQVLHNNRVDADREFLASEQLAQQQDM
eukprot:scaffold988_cov165-Ochromonas_danica.AAC.65